MVTRSIKRQTSVIMKLKLIIANDKKALLNIGSFLYLNVLRSAFEVAIAENNISYIILGITAPLPFIIAIIIALIKLIKKEN